jgi:hypothetical protein
MPGTPKGSGIPALREPTANSVDEAERVGKGPSRSYARESPLFFRLAVVLKSAPEKDIYNPHGLQKPVSRYQLM